MVFPPGEPSVWKPLGVVWGLEALETGDHNGLSILALRTNGLNTRIHLHITASKPFARKRYLWLASRRNCVALSPYEKIAGAAEHGLALKVSLSVELRGIYRCLYPLACLQPFCPVRNRRCQKCAYCYFPCLYSHAQQFQNR